MLNSPSTGSCQYGIGIPHDLTLTGPAPNTEFPTKEPP